MEISPVLIARALLTTKTRPLCTTSSGFIVGEIAVMNEGQPAAVINIGVMGSGTAIHVNAYVQPARKNFVVL